MKIDREKNEIDNTDIAGSSPISTPTKARQSGKWHSKVFNVLYLIYSVNLRVTIIVLKTFKSEIARPPSEFY